MEEGRFDWTYGGARSGLERLRQVALARQWDVDLDVEWSQVSPPEWRPEHFPLDGTSLYQQLDSESRHELRADFCGYMVSQLLHGEQGALVASGQLVAALPRLDAKAFASSQVADEARHMLAFDRYLSLSGARRYAASGELERLLAWTVRSAEWDLKLLGMNVLIEGVALAVLSTLQRTACDPVLARICQLVLRDEVRHVAFNGHMLPEQIRGLSVAARREREDFVFEGTRLMHTRFFFEPVWLEADLPVEPCIAAVRTSPHQIRARQILFSTVIRTLQQIGLFSERLEAHLRELGVCTIRRAPRRHSQ